VLVISLLNHYIKYVTIMDIMYNENEFKISVIGAGSWGTTIAKHLAEKGFDITLWVKGENVRESILRTRENNLYLPKIKLPDNIHQKLFPREVSPSRFLQKKDVTFPLKSEVLKDGSR